MFLAAKHHNSCVAWDFVKPSLRSFENFARCSTISKKQRSSSFARKTCARWVGEMRAVSNNWRTLPFSLCPCWKASKPGGVWQADQNDFDNTDCWGAYWDGAALTGRVAGTRSLNRRRVVAVANRDAVSVVEANEDASTVKLRRSRYNERRVSFSFLSQLSSL